MQPSPAQPTYPVGGRSRRAAKVDRVREDAAQQAAGDRRRQHNCVLDVLEGENGCR